MTDDRSDEPDFDDSAHLEVRDLLASARLDAPIPADVAARLDATLAELTGRAGPADPVQDTTVVPLRRRSRLAPRLLAAAAVVVVGGGAAVGLNQVAGHRSSSDDKAGSAVAADSSGGKSLTETPPTPESAAPQAPVYGDVKGFSADAGIPVLTSADFGAADQGAASLVSGLSSTEKLQWAARLPAGAARKADGVTTAPTTSASPESLALNSLQRTAAKARACAGPKIAGTRSYPIILDGEPAVLLVHPAEAGSRLVEAWSCNGSTVLASATIPD
jgi:hypothetical protein